MSVDPEVFEEQYHNHHFYPEHNGTPYPEPWDMDQSTGVPGIQQGMAPQSPQAPVNPFRGHIPQPQMLTGTKKPLAPPVGGPVGQPAVTFRSPLESMVPHTALPDHLQELLSGIDAAKKAGV